MVTVTQPRQILPLFLLFNRCPTHHQTVTLLQSRERVPVIIQAVMFAEQPRTCQAELAEVAVLPRWMLVRMVVCERTEPLVRVALACSLQLKQVISAYLSQNILCC